MDKIDRSEVIIIAGATATGKSGAAIAIAEALGGEIVSADALQVYNGMDIGTAKLKAEEMRGISHHMIDVVQPDEPFSVAMYQCMARAAVDDIVSRGKRAIITGGTGLYINSIVYDMDFTGSAPSEELREALNAKALELGANALHDELRAIDPASAKRLHPNDVKRVVRALEVWHETGKPFSEYADVYRERVVYPFKGVLLSVSPRYKLYERIEHRVDEMMQAGLENEVKTLYQRYGESASTALSAIGYKELIRFFTGKLSRDEAIALIKQNTRNYAKRQETFFRREHDYIGVDVTNGMDIKSLLALLNN